MITIPAPTASAPRLAIIGDVGGHLQSLWEQLVTVGVDVDAGVIPPELIVCQVGDLVHKGPDSDAVVDTVDALINTNPGRWVQLVGNHESQYLPGGTHFWNQPLARRTTATVRRWWDTGRMNVAATFTLAPASNSDASTTSDLLVTHAGLTAGAWKLLGAPATTNECADRLNDRSHPVVWREGEIITGANDLSAGPLWAVAASEVYASWTVHRKRTGNLPQFAQAHGHTSPYWWRRQQWAPPLPALEAAGDVELACDPQRLVTYVCAAGCDFYGTDPGAGVTPRTVSVPLVLPLPSNTPADDTNMP